MPNTPTTPTTPTTPNTPSTPTTDRARSLKRRPPEHPVVTILGLGQMGLVCAGVLSAPENGGVGGEGLARPVRVRMWGHSPEEAGLLAQSRRSPRLDGFTLPASVEVALRDEAALADTSLIVSAVPVQFMREAWTRLGPLVPEGVPVVSVAKGIETSTLLRPTQVIADVLRSAGRAERARSYACLSGPTIAAELARCLPAAMIAASDDPALAASVQRLFGCSWMRVYTHTDVIGVELAGATKNVIAIAAGVIDGLRAGYNAKSALLARGLAEITRLGVALGARPDTFFGIAGVGDLATSCFSPEGRNRSCGEALGRGQTLAEHLASIPFVVEGVQTTRAVRTLARAHGVDVPIIDAVHGVLFENLDPIDAIGGLMAREPKPERIG